MTTIVPIPYIGFYVDEEGGAKLSFRAAAAGRNWQVRYAPAPTAIARAVALNPKFKAPTKPILLIEGDPGSDIAIIHPLTMDANSPRFLQSRHDRLATVSLVNFGLTDIEGLSDVEWHLDRLPTGLVRDPYRGLGLNFDIRLITETVQRLRSVTDLRITKKAKGVPELRGTSYALPFSVFDEARKEIGRIHRRALVAAGTEKAARLQDRLLHPIDPKAYPVVGQPYQPDAIVRAVGGGIAPGLELSEADATVLVDATLGLVGDVARREPSKLLRLTEAVETVTLEGMIGQMRRRIADGHTEANWQAFLKDNAFILRLAFGVPVLLFQGEATVGGRTYDGSGGKRSDFLMKAAKSGNLSIVEIKRPDTDLLDLREYRGGIHAPHRELSGAVAQAMDQRWHLQRNNAMLVDALRRATSGPGGAEDGGPGPETYAVQCVVVAGTIPADLNLLKSFELYRNGLAGVTVITFDELLMKLTTLLQLLKDPDAGVFVSPKIMVKKRQGRRKRRAPT